MNKILSENEIQQFRDEGAVFLKNKFNINWINKLKKGIERDINNPSPRFKSHTIEKNVPAYLEDYWTWHLIPEFKEFVYNSPYAQIASELTYDYKGYKIKGTRNEAGWNSVYVAGRIIEKIGPILAINNKEILVKNVIKKPY